jgi:cytochrome c-type biogenesis protein CcmH/NrfG
MTYIAIGVLFLMAVLFIYPVLKKLKFVLFTALAFVAAGSISVYMKLGAPNMPDYPYRVTQNESHEFQRYLVELESFLRKHPKDSKAWEMKGRALRNMGQYEKAYVAFTKAIKFGTETAELKQACEECLKAIQT